MKKKLEEKVPPSQYLLYLGCTVPVRALQYEISARKVAERLGIQFVDIAEFSCCGYPIKSVNHDAYLLMAARNLALAEKRGLPICTLCSSCGGSLAEAAVHGDGFGGPDGPQAKGPDGGGGRRDDAQAPEKGPE